MLATAATTNYTYQQYLPKQLPNSSFILLIEARHVTPLVPRACERSYTGDNELFVARSAHPMQQACWGRGGQGTGPLPPSGPWLSCFTAAFRESEATVPLRLGVVTHTCTFPWLPHQCHSHYTWLYGCGYMYVNNM